VVLQVKAGNVFGMKVSAFITNMDCPLGKAVGNALEVAESIDCLNNKGPQDLEELVVTFGKLSPLELKSRLKSTMYRNYLKSLSY
jgi:thymidine phosphorylase